MIRRALSFVFLLAAASIAAAQGAPSQTPSPASAPAKTTPPAAPHTNLKVGQAAPDFTLPSTIVGADGRGVRYKLSDFKGKKNVVLAFYVLAFTGG
jgi:cytochrome oxidase Cu insertion factor (SCO1/SenC/PrrC family)